LFAFDTSLIDDLLSTDFTRNALPAAIYPVIMYDGGNSYPTLKRVAIRMILRFLGFPDHNAPYFWTLLHIIPYELARAFCLELIV